MRDDPGTYDHLIDAERETLARSGRPVGKIALIKALREASGLGLADAKRHVEGYLARRGGLTSGREDFDRPPGWIDDLLDAERAAASKEDRPVNKIVLIKAVRGAAGLGLLEAKLAVEGYLRRRGGEDLPTGSNGLMVALAVIAVIAAVVFFAIHYGVQKL